MTKLLRHGRNSRKMEQHRTKMSKCHEYKGGWTPEEYSPAYKRRMAEARRHLIQLQSAPSKEGLPTKPNYITGFPS